MAEQMQGDFIGFKFGEDHSSTLGIVRVSDGSRYNENLLPTIQDKVIQVPGGDGNYYFGSYYTQKPFNIPIAFDNLTDEQLRKIKQAFGSKTMQKLSFDERPDVFYWAKSTGTPNLKFICFDDGNGGNIYKGEGTISLVAHDPYGYSTNYLYSMAEKQTGTENAFHYKFSVLGAGQDNSIPTEVDTDWQIFIQGRAEGAFTCSGWHTQEEKDSEKKFTIRDGCVLQDGDQAVEINTKTGLIYGLTSFNVTDGNKISYQRSGNVYNKFLQGELFKITPTTTSIIITVSNDVENVTPNCLYYRNKYY